VTAIERTPSVTVEEIVVDGVARPSADPLAIGPGRPNLEFRYTGLSLSAPQHVTFRYRLEGFDEDWVLAGTRRIAYYPRLEPGQYRFVVTAANRDGAWNPAGASLRLRVATPFWNMGWFRLAVVAGLLGLLVGVWRRRETAARRARAAREEFSRRLLESQEHERKRIAGELHDGLGQELLVVKNRALLALGSEGLRPPAREQLQQITAVVTQSLENVRGLAHNLTPYQLDHLGLSAALRAMIEAVAETTEISLEASVDDIDDLLPVASQINLYRIAQEGLSNVARHSAAATARIEIRRAGDSIDLTIADDGRGFAVRRDGDGRPAGGFGLSGIAERARIIGGKVEVVSAPGRGTRIVLSLPVGP
ncbi:MAG: triple tyrosine motif-containing protein, partial [Gemmatimonadales bacterium]|nr:triple tyrosine motif-containing protein [Gemmatimonadales bacterium]